MIALSNNPETGWQRVRTEIGDEWHFSELKGDQWSVETPVEQPEICAY